MKRRKNESRRGLALFLAILMCLNMLSLTAFADASDPGAPPETTEEEIQDVLPPTEAEDGEEPAEDEAVTAPDEETESPEEQPADSPEEKEEPDGPQEEGEDVPQEEQTVPPEETFAPETMGAGLFSSRSSSGWQQDAQTIQNGESDAVCADVDGGLHLTAESDAGSYRGSDTTRWPTVFINDQVSQELAAAETGKTRYVEMTFIPASDASKSFGVFINYTNPGNGFVVCYDNASGWYWQVCSTTGAAENYKGSGVTPTQNTETTLRLEWKDNLLKVVVGGTTLFENVDISANTGTGFGLKCANGADVTISNFEYGVVTVEEPDPSAISGTVTDTNGPVSGAVVTLEDASYMPVEGKTATTGTDGRFSFEGVTGTGYKVKVQASGYQVTTVDASEATNVALTAETTGTKVYTNNDGDLTQLGGLTETNGPTFATVDGAVKVTFNGDRSANSAVVKEFDFVNGEISFDATPTGNASRFGVTLRGTAGDNRIFVGQNYTTSTWIWNTWANNNEKFNTSQDKTDVPLSVQSGVTRNVRARIEGSTVSVYLDGIEAYTITLPDGIPTGAGYAGIVVNSADPIVIDNIRVVSFDSDEPVTYTLSGTVTGENGAAVSGATVTVDGKTAITNASGAYSIAGLESGTYTVKVSAEGYIEQSAQVTVSSNTIKSWTLAKPDPGATYTVKGSVNYMPGNNSLAFWTILVKKNGETVQTVEGGKKTCAFTIEGLTPGKYTLEVSSWNFQTAEQEIEIVDQNLDAVHIQLYRAEKQECGVVPGTVFYELDGTELHITGEGAIIDWAKVTSSYAFDDLATIVPWGKTKLTKVTIDEGVTSIGNKSFSGQHALKEVNLPSSVTRIGNDAFNDCYYLEYLSIPAGVTEIGDSAFEGCTKLNNVTLPAGLTEIAREAFYKCRAFTAIVIPDGVTKIGKSAFSSCNNLASVSWGSVKEIGESAFSGCSAITSAVLPETVTILNDQAFYGTGLTSIVIPDDVALRNKVFQNCYNLENVVLLGEPHLTWTDKSGYGESSNSVFQEVYNYDHPLFIYASGDAWMAKLAKMSTTGVKTYYIANLDGGVLDGTFETGKLATPTREGYTFQGWKDAEGNGLTADTPSGTVFTAQWSEGPQEPEYIAQGECGKIEETVFYGLTADGVLHIWGEGEMKDYAQLPGGDYKKGPEYDKRSPWIAYNLSYTSVEIGEGVTSIGTYAFQIADPKYGSTNPNLQSITFPQSSLTKIGNDAFRDSNLTGEIVIPNSVTSIGTSVFIGTKITSAVLPEGITVVPKSLFSGCVQLTDVTIPEGVIIIGERAFNGCGALTSVTIPNTVTTINSSAFAECGLTSVTLPNSVKTLNNTAFWNCPNLESVDLGSVQTINNQAFQNCPKLTTIELPATLKSLGSAFRGTGISSITVPDGVELKSQAFDQMAALRNIILLGTPKLAGSNGGSFGWMSSMGENIIFYVGSETLAEAVGAEAEIGLKFGYKPDVSDIFYYIANLDGGTLTKEVAPGKLAPAAKEGYVFQGWYNGDNALTADEDGYYAIPAGTARGTVYTAKWEEPKVYHTVTFDAGSGTLDGAATVMVEEGQTVETLPTATRSGYAFKGWFNGSDEFTTETPVTGDITVTAKWVQLFNVTIEDGHGGDIFKTVRLPNVEAGTTVSAGDIDEIIAKGEAMGWKLLGWSVKSSNNPVAYQPHEPLKVINKNSIKFYAKWELIPTTPVFPSGRNIHIDIRDENNGLLTATGFTSEDNVDGRYFTLGEVIKNDGTNTKAPVADYPYQCTLTLHTEAMIARHSATTGIRVLDGEAHPQITLYCRGSDGRWATWVDGVGPYSYVVNYTINLKLPSYTVIVDGTEHTVKHGDTLAGVLPTEDPTREGYTFQGWYDGETKVTADTVVTSDMTTIESKWEINSYTVTVDGAKHPVKHGDTLAGVLPTEDPTREGYTFQGWYDGETEVTADTKVTGDMDIEPKWEINSYTVTVDGTEHTVEYGSTLAGILPADPVREGYTFLGWYDGDTRVTAETEVTGDMTIAARWTRNAYTVTVDGVGYAAGYGDTLAGILPADPVREGYTFLGWYEGDTRVTAATQVTGNMTIASRWARNVYTVTFDANGGVLTGEAAVSVAHGETVAALPAVSRMGYLFNGWFVGEAPFTADTAVTSDVTVTARWILNSSGGGVVTPITPVTPNTPAAPSNPGSVEIDTPDVPLAEVSVSTIFTDVDADRWYTESVQYVYDKELMGGVTADSFAPGMNITRSMIATILHRMEGTPEAGESGFTDVKAGAWYEKAVAWAAENGIVKGYGNGLFGPEDDITREQLAAILYRYAESKGYDVSARSDLSGYVDADEIHDYAAEAMSWANAVGLITGTTGSALNPRGNATRAEVAAILMRFHQSYVETGDADK